MTNTQLNKQSFFNANLTQKSLVRVDIPALDGHIFVRKMTVADRFEFENLVVSEGAEYSGKVRQTLIICTACDSEGNRLFDFSDMDELDKLPFEVIDHIHRAADDINLITRAAQERAEKN